MPVQVTTHGGFAAYPSRVGTRLYYSKFNMPKPEVWSVPTQGGVETLVSPLLHPESWASWAPSDKGIYLAAMDPRGRPSLMFFDFACSQVKKMSVLDKLSFWLSVSLDGNSVLYEHFDQQDSHIMLLKNFQ